MDKYIAYCGLDCKKCEAFLATINNDNDLRVKVAKKWSELNNVSITPEMINCEGCRLDGLKTPFCASLCEIRKCALNKKFETCGKCIKIDKCEKISMIINTNKEACDNLKRS